jgi:hypothetical protein
VIPDVVAKVIREAYKSLDLPFGGQPRKVQYTVYFVARKVQSITIYRVADILYLGESQHAFRRVEGYVVLKKSLEDQPQVFYELVIVLRRNDAIVEVELYNFIKQVL